MTRSQQLVSINTFRIKSQHAALFRRFFHVWRSPYVVVAHSQTNAIVFFVPITHAIAGSLHSTSKPPHTEIVDPQQHRHQYRSTSQVEDRVSTQRRTRRHTAQSPIWIAVTDMQHSHRYAAQSTICNAVTDTV